MPGSSIVPSERNWESPELRGPKTRMDRLELIRALSRVPTPSHLNRNGEHRVSKASHASARRRFALACPVLCTSNAKVKGSGHGDCREGHANTQASSRDFVSGNRTEIEFRSSILQFEASAPIFGQRHSVLPHLARGGGCLRSRLRGDSHPPEAMGHAVRPNGAAGPAPQAGRAESRQGSRTARRTMRLGRCSCSVRCRMDERGSRGAILRVRRRWDTSRWQAWGDGSQRWVEIESKSEADQIAGMPCA
jgi:hypothetical protein